MSYHELRETNPVSARMLVRKILAQNNGNVSKTAKILGIDRKTVRRARDGTLEDLSRRPKNIKNKT
jgi:DNA-binding NtrC family response regulator